MTVTCYNILLNSVFPYWALSRRATWLTSAQRKGISTVVKFFGANTARLLVIEGQQADLLLGNNVLAHVPDINDFVKGMKILLKPHGVITMEFPHLMRLMERNQFDTIYHEHFSYLSLVSVSKIFAAHGLTLFDVEEIPTHGGSLRIYAGHSGDVTKRIAQCVSELKEREETRRCLAGLSLSFVHGEGERHQTKAARVSNRHETTKEIDRRLWGSRKGQHSSKLLRDSHGFSRLRC